MFLSERVKSNSKPLSLRILHTFSDSSPILIQYCLADSSSLFYQENCCLQKYMTQAQMKQAMKTVRNVCLPKSGVSKDALAKMLTGEFDAEDRKLKCYLGCVLGMMQAVKNNKVSLNMIRNQVTKMLAPDVSKKIMAAFESCEGSTGEDNCDLAFNFAKCVYDADPENFFVP
ncbi:general odorant-binding protein 56d-like isoform X1 [Cimex lectularius]|uniref:Odorant binding protein n=1 Tax=Cimex lectularius TaxID=79782 RepID=A0A8I6SSB4_CIMLE|nr:general odorant-binding protein 56d-like isoform X1 [Cimex lectularius]